MGRILEARRLKTEGKCQALSVVGSGAILISAFAPIANVPVIGAVTYFDGTSGFALAIGMLLVALGIGSLSLALIEKYEWHYPIGFCALSIAIGTLATWKWYLARITSGPNTEVSGVFDYVRRSASKGLVGRSSLSFEIPLLIYGAVLVMLAALMRPRRLAAVKAESPPN